MSEALVAKRRRVAAILRRWSEGLPVHGDVRLNAVATAAAWSSMASAKMAWGPIGAVATVLMAPNSKASPSPCPA